MEWTHERYVTIFLLTVLDVIQPLFPKRSHVEVMNSLQLQNRDLQATLAVRRDQQRLATILGSYS